MDSMQVQGATGGKRPQQIDSGGGLHEGLVHPLRIRGAIRLCEARAVNNIAPVRRELQFLVLHLLIRRGSRLRELASRPKNLDDRLSEGVHKHDGHLDDEGEGILNIGASVPVELREGLGAIAALYDEGVARGDAGEAGFEVLALAGEDEREGVGELALHGGEGLLRGVVGDLLDGHGAPRGGRPDARGGVRGDHARRGGGRSARAVAEGERGGRQEARLRRHGGDRGEETAMGVLLVEQRDEVGVGDVDSRGGGQLKTRV